MHSYKGEMHGFKSCKHCLKGKSILIFALNICVIQFVWASENQVGPVDFKRLLDRGPVGKYPNVAAWHMFIDVTVSQILGTDLGMIKSEKTTYIHVGLCM